MAFPITPSATLRIVSAAALIAASGLPLAAAEGAATPGLSPTPAAATAAPATALSSTNLQSQILELAGTVQVAPAGSTEWVAARLSQPLKPGDHVRTGIDSRATLLLSDRSILRLNQSTLVEIQPPTQSISRKRFRLRAGKLFFLNREKPSDVEFETPLATGAIRGTEFLLEVDAADGTTKLALLDGEVDLRANGQVTRVEGGEQALLKPGGSVAKSPVLQAVNLIQWVLYYPGVLNLEDLHLTPAERAAWKDSFDAYEAGDLPGALRSLPPGAAAGSEGAHAYLASLRLAVGQVEEANTLLAGLPVGSPGANALRELVAAVKTQTPPPEASPGTASEWLARSYRLQSASRLEESLTAARQAVRLAPGFGFAWVRVAELEFGFEHLGKSREALLEGRRLSPRNAHAVALEGFTLLANHHTTEARLRFEEARRMDGAFAMAWVGQALCLEREGATSQARQLLEVAAALEPQRGILRSYLGKAWSQLREDALADREFGLAKQLDPADPTAWLYSALAHQQTHRLNTAVRDLEESIEKNENRSLFRSRLLLDRDRSIRSADLSTIYEAVGLRDASVRTSSRSVQEDYSSFSGHLFLSQSFQAGSIPNPFDLRLETPRQSELLVANLLAPPGGGNLSLLLSQQDHLQYFDPRSIGASSFTEYRSTGDFSESATLFGQVQGLSYAVDGQYSLLNDRRPNNDLRSLSASTQVKQELTPSDSLYLQAGYSRNDGGDLGRYYDPASANTLLRFKEAQEPNVSLGFHHEWAPGSHTLLYATRIQDRLTLTGPDPNALFLHQAAGTITSAAHDPFFSLTLHSEYTLHSIELQQIWESEHHTLVAGGRYQQGSAETEAEMTRGLQGVVSSDSTSPDLERLNGYAFYTWHPVESLHLTAGLSYDDLTFPRNVDLPPISTAQDHASRLSPKLGLTLRPWKDGYLRAAFSRSLGGLYFDDSVRLEPTQIAGFVTSYRSLIPESSAGLLAGADFETWGVGFDQKFPHGTYAGISAELLKSDGQRSAGAYTNSTFLAIPDSATQTWQSLDYEERSLTAYVSQLLGEEWATGARYHLSKASLEGRFLSIPAGAAGLASLNQDEQAVLGELKLFLIWNHPSGFFAEWDSDWYRQSNRGYTPDRPGDSFWHHNLHLGYRLPHRRAEIRVGLLNLADQDYRMNPLNWMATDPAPRRTIYTSLRINF